MGGGGGGGGGEEGGGREREREKGGVKSDILLAAAAMAIHYRALARRGFLGGPFAPSRALSLEEGPMAKTVRAGLGWLALVLGLAACAGSQGSPLVAGSQSECERSGGMWRAATAYCERSSGGGGGY